MHGAVTAAAATKIAAAPVLTDPGGMTAKAARYLLERGDVAYALGGRGPDEFDGYGFVRFCVAAIFDARQLLLDEKPRMLPDRSRAAYRKSMPPGGRTPADEVPVEPDAHDLEQVCLAAGMIQVPGRGQAVVKAGDVILYLGHGPAGAVVIEPRSRSGDDLVALMWEEAPRVHMGATMGRHRVRVYRWPEAGAVS